MAIMFISLSIGFGAATLSLLIGPKVGLLQNMVMGFVGFPSLIMLCFTGWGLYDGSIQFNTNITVMALIWIIGLVTISAISEEADGIRSSVIND